MAEYIYYNNQISFLCWEFHTLSGNRLKKLIDRKSFISSNKNHQMKVFELRTTDLIETAQTLYNSCKHGTNNLATATFQYEFYMDMSFVSLDVIRHKLDIMKTVFVSDISSNDNIVKLFDRYLFILCQLFKNACLFCNKHKSFMDSHQIDSLESVLFNETLFEFMVDMYHLMVTIVNVNNIYNTLYKKLSWKQKRLLKHLQNGINGVRNDTIRVEYNIDQDVKTNYW